MTIPAAEEPSFDRVFSIDLIQFIAHKPGYVADCIGRLTPNGIFATTFQPRGGKPTREAALQMAELVANLSRASRLSDVRTEILELNPVPAVCVLGGKGRAPGKL